MNRFAQSNREALYALGLAGLYALVWWGGSLLEGKGTLFGMPLWFAVSCVFGPLLFCLLPPVMIKLFYRDIDLGDDDE